MKRAPMRALALAGMIGALTPAPSSAADLAGYEPIPPITEPGGFEARWESAVALYLWMPGLKGSVGVAGLGPVDVDLTFSDLLDDLDFAYMGVAEFRNGRWGVFGDLVYTRTTSGATGPLGILSASLTNELTVGTLMAQYRVVSQPRASVDLMAGARVWGTSSDLTVTLAPLPGLDISASGSKTWVDPMIGVKSRVDMTARWYLTGWAMIGGFGAAADIDWDLFGGLGYEVSDRLSLVAGYRAMGVDYTDGGFVFDIVKEGPVVGGVVRF